MTHVSSIVHMDQPLSGLLSVTIRCCNDPKTDYALTLHRLDRSDEEILKDIEDHKGRVEQLHAHHERAKELMRTLGATIEGCGCP